MRPCRYWIGARRWTGKGAGIGALIGGVIGILGGPAGVAIGGIASHSDAGFNNQTLERIGGALPNGTSALAVTTSKDFIEQVRDAQTDQEAKTLAQDIADEFSGNLNAGQDVLMAMVLTEDGVEATKVVSSDDAVAVFGITATDQGAAAGAVVATDDGVAAAGAVAATESTPPSWSGEGDPPPGYPIKGNEKTMLYHTPDSHSYGQPTPRSGSTQKTRSGSTQKSRPRLAATRKRRTSASGLNPP